MIVILPFLQVSNFEWDLARKTGGEAPILTPTSDGAFAAYRPEHSSHMSSQITAWQNSTQVGYHVVVEDQICCNCKSNRIVLLHLDQQSHILIHL